MALLLVLSGCTQPKTSVQQGFVGSEIDAHAVASDFRLIDHVGHVRTMAGFRGKVVALFFGYTHCPDVCPTTLSDLAKAVAILSDRRSQVQVLFVTLDPERDTQQVLAQYVPSFEPTFIGLYSDVATLTKVESDFRIYAHKQPSAGKSGYSIDHSAGVYLFDKEGAPRVYLNYGQKPSDIAHDMELLM